MTKEQHRDKENSARSHRKKINGKMSPDAGARFIASGVGIVNLACCRVCGKVATKVGVPLIPLRLLASTERFPLLATGEKGCPGRNSFS